jgi:hypothetical protein
MAFKDSVSGTLSGCSAVAVNTTTGIATCAITYEATGSHSITADYGGNGTFGASSTGVLVETIKTGTHTKITTSKNPGVVGTALTYTATVTPVPSGGTMAFKDSVSGTLSGCSAVAVNTTTGIATFGASSTGVLVETITAANGPRHRHSSSHRLRRSGRRR